jgi:hypothetical protein
VYCHRRIGKSRGPWERANPEETQLGLVSDRDECIAEVGETMMKARNRGVAHEQHNLATRHGPLILSTVASDAVFDMKHRSAQRRWLAV